MGSDIVLFNISQETGVEGHSGQKCHWIMTCVPLDRNFILLDRTLIPLDRTLIPLDRTSVSLDSALISLGGVLPMMAYTGRLRPKGLPFSGLQVMKG